MFRLGKSYDGMARCRSGTTAIEFAMILPVFMMLMMGIIEMAMIMFTSAVLESATTNTARLGKTGYVATGMTRQQEIINDVDARTAGLLNPNLITVTTLVYPNMSDVGQPEPCISPSTPPCPGTPGVNFVDINGNGVWDADMGVAGLGGAGAVVVYTVSYPWALLTPVLNNVVGTNGVITLSARAVVQNEPF